MVLLPTEELNIVENLKIMPINFILVLKILITAKQKLDTLKLMEFVRDFIELCKMNVITFYLEKSFITPWKACKQMLTSGLENIIMKDHTLANIVMEKLHIKPF